MKILVSDLQGTNFAIEVNSNYTVAYLKEHIEAVARMFPVSQQLLIHQWTVLKDETTLEENGIGENSFILIMLTKGLPNVGLGDSLPNSQLFQAFGVMVQPMFQELGKQISQLMMLIQTRPVDFLRSINEPLQSEIRNTMGRWPSAIPQGIPRQASNPPAQPAQPPFGTSSVVMFPQGLPSVGLGAAASPLDFLRDSQQFQYVKALVQANPQTLQPMLLELGKQNPHLRMLIQSHEADFLRLISEPLQNGVGTQSSAMPQALTFKP